MKKRRERGRPMNPKIFKALEIIKGSEEPISTTQLIRQLKLDYNQGLMLRRVLREAQKRGEIREVGVHQDKSITWLRGEFSVARCAGHAVNLFLDRESPGKRIDTEKFEDWLLNEQQLQS